MTTALPISAPSQAQVLQLAADFVIAARMFRAGSAETAMVRLLPLHLAEDELSSRVRLLVAAGVAVTLARTRVSPSVLQSLITTHDEHLVDLLVELVALFAAHSTGEATDEHP